jgi:hypothetical protein
VIDIFNQTDYDLWAGKLANSVKSGIGLNLMIYDIFEKLFRFIFELKNITDRQFLAKTTDVGWI